MSADDLFRNLVYRNWGVKFSNQDFVHFYELEDVTGENYMHRVICTKEPIEPNIRDIQFYCFSTEKLHVNLGRHVSASDPGINKPMNLCESCKLVMTMRELAK